ncbi:hypothetical protein JG687_00015693 [Phytophthora cactorum]|uniref:Uncharacterized protein n=1 Tax=Phytophthora cactorum TaxID=29920 RepID=A0A8T1TW81_9STRA|nr:hypothetical protein GQ600_10199 [Phytophthora cactorum]KAG6948085.1 hypothetical protein JG687_00015693 [Phytophthora cactorum]
MNADKTGWNVVVPAKGSAKTGTVMLTCVRNVPMHLSKVVNHQPTVRLFANKLVQWGSENCNEASILASQHDPRGLRAFLPTPTPCQRDRYRQRSAVLRHSGNPTSKFHKKNNLWKIMC